MSSFIEITAFSIKRAKKYTKPNANDYCSIWKKLRLFFLFVCFISIVECQNIHDDILEELSLKEYEELKLLFHYLFAEHEFGYTLLGDKPMSFCLAPTCSIAFATKEHFFKIFYKNRLDLKNALFFLKKLQKFKIKSNYIFIVFEIRGFPDYVFFINKNAFTQVFNNNIDFFKRTFGNKITLESFLDAFQNKSLDIDELFEEHEILGIMCGYGRDNAKLFARRQMLIHGRKKIPYTVRPKPSRSFSTVEEEVCFLNQHLKLINSNDLGLLKLDQVNFAANYDSLETIQLRKDYYSIRRKLTYFFSNENWFEMILEKLCLNE